MTASRRVDEYAASGVPSVFRNIGILLPKNQRQHRNLDIKKNVLPCTLCYLLSPVSAALASIFRMDSNSTSYLYVQHVALRLRL